MDSRRGCGPFCLLVLLVVMVTDARSVTADQARPSFPWAVACLPAFRDAIPPRYRRICVAIDAASEQDLASIFNQDITDGGPEVMAGSRTEVAPSLVLDNAAAAGVKRQDMDHVFFRFGRRQK